MPQLNASLFKNSRKETEKQPDFTGPGQVTKEDFMTIADAITAGNANFNEDGSIKLRVAGWKRQSKSGINYISLSIQIDDYNVQKSAPAKSTVTDEDMF